MFKRKSFQIAGIALICIVILGITFPEQILNQIFKYKLSWEISKIRSVTLKRNRSRTQAEIDEELAQLTSLLKWGDSEKNTDALIAILSQNPDIHILRLAIDLTNQREFKGHTHSREELFEFVASYVHNNPKLIAELQDDGRQIGMKMLADFIKFAGSQH